MLDGDLPASVVRLISSVMSLPFGRSVSVPRVSKENFKATRAGFD
jgi:hypothetical protein